MSSYARALKNLIKAHSIILFMILNSVSDIGLVGLGKVRLCLVYSIVQHGVGNDCPKLAGDLTRYS